MINQYPLWKYLMLVVVIAVAAIFAMPNLYGQDYALQISPAKRSVQVDETTLSRVLVTLRERDINYLSEELSANSLLVRFADNDTQLRAYELVSQALGFDYTVAMNLAPTTPDWLVGLNAAPMNLGLDLRGGVHFLLEVDMDKPMAQALDGMKDRARTLLREEEIAYAATPRVADERLVVSFKDADALSAGRRVIRGEYPGLEFVDTEEDGSFVLYASLSEPMLREIKERVTTQNITTLRKRINQLGVAEPVIQRQGYDRIVVQLPGIQDTAMAKRMLAATATLEYHMVDEVNSLQAALAGRVPPGSRVYYRRDGTPVLLKTRVIVTGDQVTNASSQYDPQQGGPLVSITLNSEGAYHMGENTKRNLNKPMAVVFIENRPVKREVNGQMVEDTVRTEEVISVATIQGIFSSRFQVTGLDDMAEATELALLLRAGALAAPVRIVEERTIGPSLGAKNIEKGLASVVIGFLFVLAFMVVWYKGFGMVANLALALNLVIIVAVLSMLQAVLTLPGIAGIVLTVGMAVDANVLIFERIREELRAGNTPHASIHAGYEKALGTIADANITTLIAAVVLLAMGSGPVQGFAVTLAIGILTSMFTAIVGTRAVINLAISGKRLTKLSI